MAKGTPPTGIGCMRRGTNDQVMVWKQSFDNLRPRLGRSEWLSTHLLFVASFAVVAFHRIGRPPRASSFALGGWRSASPAWRGTASHPVTRRSGSSLRAAWSWSPPKTVLWIGLRKGAQRFPPDAAPSRARPLLQTPEL